MIVVVVEGCDIHVKLWFHQAPVSGFVADQVFRGKPSVANNAIKGERVRRRHCSELEIFFHAGGCAHGTSNGGPDSLPLIGRPQDSCARLDLKATVTVVEKLRANRQRKPIANERYFVLEEAAVELVREVPRREYDGGINVGSIARTQASSKPPKEVLPPRQDQVMDKINIEGVARLGEIGLFPVGAIIVGLHLNVGSCGQ